LPPKSALVVANAPYHNVQFNKAPTSQTTKEWLTVNNVPFRDGMLTIQLYGLIKAHKPRHKNFATDNIMAALGHAVLRLPPYHPDLNPTELVWADVKESVGAENVSFNLDEMAKKCGK
jgi:transposase